MPQSALRLVPRTIRGQLIVGTVTLQCILAGLFLWLAFQRLNEQSTRRSEQRLEFQANLLARLAGEPVQKQNADQLNDVVDALLASTSVRAVQIVGRDGSTLVFKSKAAGLQPPLGPSDAVMLRGLRTADIRHPSRFEYEELVPILSESGPDRGQMLAVGWISSNSTLDKAEARVVLQTALTYAAIAILANALFSMLLAGTITRPLKRLLKGTEQMIQNAQGAEPLPIEGASLNEAGQLTEAFNTMVEVLDEQRGGLHDTLALLDSMLANAPIGFAFFDRKFRYVRINQFLADINGLPIGRHLGKSIRDVLTASVAENSMQVIEAVFETGKAARDVEISGEMPGEPGVARSWLTSFYPVNSISQDVRWVGVVVVETTQRRQAEDALRKSEKLAAAGRLAASIAHEINNPLEAITNLLYLLHHVPTLEPSARAYVEQAQHEISRVSQIAQQTLRFYRQSTQPLMANVGELIDSVLALHQGRIRAAEIEVVRNYVGVAELYALGGELRQLFANLVGNALDAMMQGGRLSIMVRESVSWAGPSIRGVRVFVADSGSGMTDAIRKRIFEPFFTTKDATGTGLGLWVSAEIIEKHDALVKVRSRAASAGGRPITNTGTVFMLFFPHRGVERHIAAVAPRAAAAGTGAGRVEAEPVVAR